MIKECELKLSEEFLTNMSKLTKTAIKTYLSLSYLRKQNFNSKFLRVSHHKIRIIDLEDGFIGVGNDYNSFVKGLKELEEFNLIKIHRSKNINGKPLTNVYEFIQ